MQEIKNKEINYIIITAQEEESSNLEKLLLLCKGDSDAGTKMVTERAEFHLSHCILCPEENLIPLCLYFLPNRHHINLINEVKMAIICEKTISKERAP